MATLPTLVTWNQFGEANPDRNEACGQSSVASILIALGHLPDDANAPNTVDAYLRSKYSASQLQTNGTMVDQLGDALVHFGVPHWQWVNNFNLIDDALARGHYAIVLVGSNSWGQIEPNNLATTGHWVAVYSNDGAVYRNANSGHGGVQETHTRAELNSAYRGVVLEVMEAPRNLGVILSTESDAINARIDALVHDIRSAHVREVYRWEFGRNEPTVAEAEWHIANTSPGNLDLMLASLFDGTAGQGSYAAHQTMAHDVTALDAAIAPLANVGARLAAAEATLAHLAPAPDDDSALTARLAAVEAAIAALQGAPVVVPSPDDDSQIAGRLTAAEARLATLVNLLKTAS